jgi:WD40 repeat protein
MAEGPVLSLAARDGAVYAGTYSGHVIALRDGRRIVSEQIGAPVPSLCLDGDVLVAGTYNGESVVLDPATLAVTARAQTHSGSVKSLVAVDGGFLSAATDRTVAAGTLRRRTTLWEHGNLVNAVAVLEQGVAASASRDHTVKVGRITSEGSAWRVEEVRTLLGPDESVKCVGLLGDRDVSVVVAGSYDFGLYTWRVDWRTGGQTLTCGRLLAEFGQGLSCMTALDRRRLVVAGWDGRVLVVRADEDGEARVDREWSVDDLAALAAPAADEKAMSA